MPSVRVTILRFADEHQPGFVECLLVDAHGKTWKFVESTDGKAAFDVFAEQLEDETLKN